jgi:hypothetical protein
MKPTGAILTVLAVIICAVSLSAQVFELGGRFATGTAPAGVAAADFDNDNDIDLAVCHTEYNAIFIYVNDGDANFAVADSIFGTHVEAYYIFATDLNNDDYIDLMSAARMFLNNGDGTFYLAYEDTLSYTAEKMCADDYDGDGIVDVAYGETYGYDAGLYILWGLGGGSFSEREMLVSVNGGLRLVSSDFDNDGDPDLFYGTSTLLNNGDGTFVSMAIDNVNFSNMVAADLDNDGNTDLVGLGQYSCAIVPKYKLGTGDGNFGETYTAFYQVGELLSTNTVCPGDFNMDGFLDLPICGGNSSIVHCGYNNGLMDYGDGPELDYLPYGYGGGTNMAAADLDNDGDTDLIVLNVDDSLTVALSRASAHSNRILIPDDIPSIGDAIDYSWNLDTLIVQPGTYAELINFEGKNLVLASQYLLTGDESYIYNTIIDGGGAGSVFTFENSEDYRATVMGFTIQNGSAAGYGGGVFCYDYSSPTIICNIIKENYSTSVAGGIMIGSHCSSLITNNVITGNSCGNWGGGIFVSGPFATIVNNTVYGNDAATDGGGVHFGYGRPVFYNNIVRNNSAGSRGNDIAYFGEDSPIITYSNIQGGWDGEGNVDIDPLFRDPDTGDFHLMATNCENAYNSPCIDIGNPEIDDIMLDCDWGLGAARSDMGAYGGGTEAMVDIDVNDVHSPAGYSLSQNYPNPFNASTRIGYRLPQQSAVTIEIFDILGRQVGKIQEGLRQAGYHQVTWDSNDLSSGIYFYRLQADNHIETKKMMLIK